MPVRPVSVPSASARTVRRVLPAVAALSALLAVTGCDKGNTDDASSIVRTTTAVAGANIVGVERDTRTACGPTAPADPADGPTRRVAGVGGDADVPADPQRIVVLSTQALDTACELGLWERVVGAATVGDSQPTYLGSGISKIPSVGSIDAPDAAKIAELHPDLILGTAPGNTADKFRSIAPTVFDGVDGGWQARFVTGARALGRDAAANAALDAFHKNAQDVGASLHSGQTEASIVHFGADDIRVQGTNSFAAQILTDVGARRPEYQRGTSFDLDPKNLEKAEGDVIFVSYAGDRGKAHAESVMKSDEWEDLSAWGDRRIWVVDDTIWSGDGLVAARSLVDDVKASLNNYAS